MSRRSMEEAFEDFQHHAQAHGFYTSNLVILERDDVYWLVADTGSSYLETLFPTILGKSKSQSIRTLDAYTAAFKAIERLKNAS